MDKAHKQTDTMLAGLELALKKMYSKAFIDLKKQVKTSLADMDLPADLSPIERYRQAQKYGRLNKIEKEFTEKLNEVNKQAVKMVNSEMFKIYKTNYSAGIDNLAVLLSMSIPNKYEKTPTNADIKEEEQSPLNEIALDNVKDIYELRKAVNRQFITGIMRGERPDELVARLSKVTELKLSDITRIARTQTTRLENMARLDAYGVGQKLGYRIVKQWVAVGDSKTRDAHRHANGQTVDIDEPFIVDGEKLMHPGAEGGSAGNVINCRCFMRAGIQKIKKS